MTLTAILIDDLPALMQGRVSLAANGCWVWTRANSDGYGQVWLPEEKKLSLVHTYVYREMVGPIPDKHDVGHVCHDRDTTCPGGGSCLHRACCRPDHLAAQTRTENNLGGRLGATQRARHAEVTHCPQGHVYDEANTYIRHDRASGGRMCRACVRERMRRRREDMRAAFGNFDPDTGEVFGDGSP